MQILPATTPEHFAVARTLFTEYAEGLGIDLSFQGFAEELAALPGKYAPPAGALLLARIDPAQPAASLSVAWVGCVALRPLGDPREKLCEMKRLFVRPAGRGQGVGRGLAEGILQEALRIGYRGMRLDTLASLTAALQLYHALGFVEIPAYYENPISEVVYLEKRW